MQWIVSSYLLLKFHIRRKHNRGLQVPFGTQVVMHLCMQLIALAQVEEGCENVYPHLSLELGGNLCTVLEPKLTERLAQVLFPRVEKSLPCNLQRFTIYKVRTLHIVDRV